MPNKELKDLLLETDILLGRLTVAGESVFSLCDARRLLKAAFNMIPNTTEPKPQGKEETPSG